MWVILRRVERKGEETERNSNTKGAFVLNVAQLICALMQLFCAWEIVLQCGGKLRN